MKVQSTLIPLPDGRATPRSAHRHLRSQTPFVNIPLYYVWSTTRLPYSQWDVRASLDALRREWRTSSLSGIALWGPAQWFQFALVPPPLRIPFMSAVAFVWSVIISLQAQLGNVRPARGFH